MSKLGQTVDEIFSELEVKYVGTAKIVSSGYADRYLFISDEVSITKGGITFTVATYEACEALLVLSGLNELKEDEYLDAVRLALDVLKRAERVRHGSYKRMSGSCTYKIQSTGAIQDALRLCIDMPSAPPEYVKAAEDKAKNLSKNDWDFISYYLNTINKEHAETGKPVVPFTIPAFASEAS